MTSVSIVPYHEILLLWVACLMALYTFFQKRYVSASICLVLACFTRFEAVVACPFSRWRRGAVAGRCGNLPYSSDGRRCSG